MSIFGANIFGLTERIQLLDKVKSGSRNEARYGLKAGAKSCLGISFWPLAGDLNDDVRRGGTTHRREEKRAWKGRVASEKSAPLCPSRRAVSTKTARSLRPMVVVAKCVAPVRRGDGRRSACRRRDEEAQIL